MQTYIINLAASSDRLSFMTKQFRQLGVDATRIEACHADRAMSLPRAAALVPVARRPLAPGELGCLISHTLAWEELLKSGKPCAAIFEDDVHLSPKVAEILSKETISLPGRWVLKLETFLYEKIVFAERPAGILGLSIARLGDAHEGSAGYIISRAAAAHLLSRPMLARPSDAILFDVTIIDVVPYQIIPALVVQDIHVVKHEGNESLTIARFINAQPFESTIPNRPLSLNRVHLNIGRRIRRRFRQQIILPLFAKRRIIDFYSAE